VRPNVLVKGGDYRREEVVGHELVEAAGGETLLVNLVPGHSTTALVRRSAAPKPAGKAEGEAGEESDPAPRGRKPALLGRKSKV
jgi:hypothetical protein